MFFIIKKFLKVYRAPILSGVLIGCSFIPFPFFALFFALVPLWFFIYQQNSLKKVIIAGFVCQIVFTLIGFNWMIYTFHYFGGMNWFLSFIFLLGFCLISNLYITFSGLIWFILTKKSPWPFSVASKLILFPVIFSILHSLVPVIFPWNMGYPWLWGGMWGAHTAELWGFRFLNTLFYVFNLLFLILYKHCSFGVSSQTVKPSNQWWRFRFANILKTLGSAQWWGSRFANILKTLGSAQWWRFRFVNIWKTLSSIRLDAIGIKTLIGVIVLFSFLNILGFYLKQRLPPTNRFLNVILIQNNVGFVPILNPKPFRTARQKSLYISKTLTYRALKKSKKQGKLKDIDLIVWAEGSYPYAINKRNKKEKRLSRLIKSIKIPLITGAISKDGRNHSNSIFVLDRQGNILKPIYDKMKLLIYGEYFPGLDWFPFLRKISPYLGSSLQAGKEVLVQELEGRRFGWQICYESLFDRHSRELANKQAQILVNVTNDSWYGSWQEPYQHLTMSFARSIEIRRPLIRVANTGYSGVIHADGTWDKILPFNKARFHLYKVPYYNKPIKTLFMGWGYYINEIFLFFLVLLVGILSFKFQKDHESFRKN